MSDYYADHVVRADFAAVKRSILRYLARYEREWGRERVWMPAWHFSGCAPPEEDGAVMTWGRVRVALGALVREGKLERKAQPFGNHYALVKPSVSRLSDGEK